MMCRELGTQSHAQPHLGDLSVPKQLSCHVALPKPKPWPRAPRQPRCSCPSQLPYLGDASEILSLQRGPQAAAALKVAVGQDLNPPQQKPSGGSWHTQVAPPVPGNVPGPH